MKKRFLILLFLVVLFLTSVFSDPSLDSSIVLDKFGNSVSFVQKEELNLAFEVMGEGNPLILINGMGCYMESWPRELIEELSGSYKVIIFDYRGMGYSSDFDSNLSYSILKDDILFLLDELRIEKTSIFAYSMGTNMAISLMIDNPERIDKVVLHGVYLSAGDLKEIIMNKIFKGREYLITPIVSSQIDLISSDSVKGIEELNLYLNPVLILVGTKDSVVGTQDSVYLSQIIENSWFVRVEGADHWMIWDIPVKIGELVKLFFNF